ncbi:MAG: nuclear transport factor 2 family protein [Geminicoccaceae bacterium]
MLRVALASWVAAFVLPVPTASTTMADDGPAAITSALTGWTETFNARRQADVCALFAPDLVATYRGQPDRNFEELCTLLKNSLQNPTRSYHYALELQEILPSGDLAAVRLVWTLTVRGADGEILETVREPGLDIFKRQPDGTWKIARFVAFATP